MQDDWGLDTGGTADGAWRDDGFAISSPGRKRFHLSLFIHALLGSVLGALIGQIIYGCMYNPSGSNAVMVGLILAVISGLILLACSLCELFRPRITMNRELNLSRILFGLLAAAAVFAAGWLCELLYEWNSAYSAVAFNDYVFAIDDSGSMSDTDAQELRYSALEELLDTMDDDNRAGLVRFDQSICVSVELSGLDEAQRTRLSEGLAAPPSKGGTDIYGALTASLDMHRNNAQAGRFPVVVLLSDGHSKVPFERTAKEFLEAGVAISTVSLGPNTDEALLQNLAQATGGQYFKVEQAGDLVQAFQQVSTAVTYRCLFGPRPGPQRGSVFYMVLRVLFLSLPGLLIGLFILLLLQNRLAGRQVLVSGAAALLAGLVMEAGTYFLLPLAAVQIISWILYGVVLLQYQDGSGGVCQSRLETDAAGAGRNSGWEDIPVEPSSGTSDIDRVGTGSSGRIDRTDDWGRF